MVQGAIDETATTCWSLYGEKELNRETPGTWIQKEWLGFDVWATRLTQNSEFKRPWAVPRKFQDVLTGPHRVVDGKANSKGEIKVFHSRRGSQEDIHKSRLVLYNPWSDQLLDTADGSMVPGYDIRSRAQQQQAPSEEVDSKFAYSEGDDVLSTHLGKL